MPYEFLEADVLILAVFSAKTQHSTLHLRRQEMLLDPAMALKFSVLHLRYKYR